jgi:hypothetical protein
MRKAPLLTRLKAKRRSQAMLVGITWYTAETWALVKANATDPERFENSFLEWEVIANSARKDLQRAGVHAIEFQVIPQLFFDWCALHNKSNIAESRAEYVAESLRLAQGSQT